MAQRKTKSQMFFSGWCFHFFKFLPIFGEDVHFDEHIFQRGWFNHQLGFGHALSMHDGQFWNGRFCCGLVVDRQRP